jgi:hemoglobin-like flavoprotein
VKETTVFFEPRGSFFGLPEGDRLSPSMNLDAPLLRANFDALRPRGVEMMRDFYGLLFERHPRLKPMFAQTDMAEQEKKIFETLDLVVRNLEQPDAVMAQLLLLGNSHVDYGVKSDHYAPVLDCLIEAMKRASGPSWTPKLESAWRDAYAVVAEIMKKGAGLRRP